MTMSWALVSGTADYECNGWRAIYLHTERGFGCYRIIRPDGTVYGVGGLPPFVREETA